MMNIDGRQLTYLSRNKSLSLRPAAIILADSEKSGYQGYIWTKAGFDSGVNKTSVAAGYQECGWVNAGFDCGVNNSKFAA